MKLDITFRGLDPIESLKRYARTKLERIGRHVSHDGAAHVVLSIERHLHHADIELRAGPLVMRGHAKSGDMYASIDGAVDRLDRQLRRIRDRRKHHHGRDRVHHGLQLVRQGDSATPRQLELVLSLDEAIAAMERSGQSSIVFSDESEARLRLVFRRSDGGFGVIDGPAALRDDGSLVKQAG